MTLKKQLLLILCLISLKNLVYAQEILGIQQKRWDAMVQRDSLELLKWNADDLFYVHSNGVLETKVAHLRNVLGKKMVYESFAYLEPPTIAKKGKLQILNGKIAVKGLYDSKPFDIKLSFLAIYVRKKGRWQLLRWQSTKIG